MNIEIANRMVELRKKAGLSQEELAEKLGISRQAVSKWERAEASPDTDNLICLAKIYGISLDELLRTDEKAEDIAFAQKERANESKQEEPKEESKEEARAEEESDDDSKVEGKKGTHVEINGPGIHVVDGDDTVHIGSGGIVVSEGEQSKVTVRFKPPIWEILSTGTLILVGLIAYIIVGLLWKEQNMGWRIGWTFLLDGIWLGSLFSAIWQRKPGDFAFPILIVSVYCKLGFLGNYYDFEGWGFYWFLFLTIPVYYMVINAINRTRHAIKHEKEEDDVIDA